MPDRERDAYERYAKMEILQIQFLLQYLNKIKMNYSDYVDLGFQLVVIFIALWVRYKI